MLAPEAIAVCAHCRQIFEQTLTGRPRRYCSARCKSAHFRSQKRNETRNESDNETGQALVEQALATGNWRYHKLPAWPQYRCLACGQAIASRSQLDAARAVVGPAWYDWKDFDHQAGVYRRVVCAPCHP